MDLGGPRSVASAASLRGNLALAARILPFLSRLRLLRIWAGPLAATPDEMPVIGEVPGWPGYFLAGGTYAFTLAPLWARCLAALAEGREPPVPLAGLGPERLPSATTMNQAWTGGSGNMTEHRADVRQRRGDVGRPAAREPARGGLLRPAQHSARYRFYSVRDEFPGLHPVPAGGASIPGELYEVSYGSLRERLLPAEPPELELGIIELADGTGSLAMRMRAAALDAAGVLRHHRPGWLAAIPRPPVRGRPVSRPAMGAPTWSSATAPWSGPDAAVRADVVIAGRPGARAGRTRDARRPGAAELDATDRLVLPGGVDPHCHVGFTSGAFTTLDGYPEATEAAVFGGTTTIVDFAIPRPGEVPLDVARRQQAKATQGWCDSALHGCVVEWDDSVPRQLREMAAMGVRTIKMFTTYRGETMASDETVFKVMKELRGLGGMAFVHCEANHIIEEQQERSAAAGRIAARYHRETRPSVAEAASVATVISMAEALGTAVYLVHQSTPGLPGAGGGRAAARRQRVLRGGDASPGPG